MGQVSHFSLEAGSKFSLSFLEAHWVLVKRESAFRQLKELGVVLVIVKCFSSCPHKMQ